jgi:Cu/Ag efflux pump CusA
LIFVLPYMAFRSFLDTAVVLSNVLDLSMGGLWALLLTGTHFSISAAVGFVSLFGVAIMDGLLMISSFNANRAHAIGLHEAMLNGAGKRVRAVTMTALAAILGLLPAALSTRIGAQTQRPLAIVLVGGMITTLFLTRYLMPVLYSFYGHRGSSGTTSGPPTGWSRSASTPRPGTCWAATCSSAARCTPTPWGRATSAPPSPCCRTRPSSRDCIPPPRRS